MKKYLIPKEGNFYKANLHMHTTISDGQMTPEETKLKYIEQGYSIIAFTDHEVMIPHKELCDDKFLAITSTEIEVKEENYNIDRKVYHLNIYSKDPNRTVFHSFDSDSIWAKHSFNYINEDIKKIKYKRNYNIHDINYIIKKAKEEDCLVSLNHPFWSIQNSKDYIDLRGLWGVEWHNNGCVVNGYMDTIQPVDDLLHEGENVFPLATDDAHNINDCFGGFVMVKSKKLDYDCIMNALEKGDFYSSNKPLINELYIEDGVVHIETSPVKKIYLSTERRYALIKETKQNEKLQGAEFNLNSYLKQYEGKDISRSYIRVTIVDHEGNIAHTRGYLIKELIA